MPAVEGERLVSEREVRKHLRSTKVREVFVTALMKDDVYYVKVSKAEATYQLRELGAGADSPITWTLVLGQRIYIEPNEDRR
jgi:hypothetical protein